MKDLNTNLHEVYQSWLSTEAKLETASQEYLKMRKQFLFLKKQLEEKETQCKKLQENEKMLRNFLTAKGEGKWDIL